jgi:ABC-2 type transport system permease protein
VKRIGALLGKEFLDLRQNPTVFLPAAIAGIASMTLPFLIAVVIPYTTGERLSDSSDFELAVEMYQAQPGSRALDPEGAVQAWLFQSFLMFLVIVPVVGATSIAGHSVVGEKRARTLEPLLSTPITTFELLAAKTLAAFLPALMLSVACFAIYVTGIAIFGRPGVAWAMLAAQPLAIVFVLGPLAVLASLQLAVAASSRVKDERAAQQVGALIVLPIAALFVAPFLGAGPMTVSLTLTAAAGLLIINAVLMRVGIAVFDRESILTRWK